MPARFSYSKGRKVPMHNFVVVLLALFATAGWVIRSIFGTFSRGLQISTATISGPRSAAPRKPAWADMPDA